MEFCFPFPTHNFLLGNSFSPGFLLSPGALIKVMNKIILSRHSETSYVKA